MSVTRCRGKCSERSTTKKRSRESEKITFRRPDRKPKRRDATLPRAFERSRGTDARARHASRVDASPHVIDRRRTTLSPAHSRRPHVFRTRLRVGRSAQDRVAGASRGAPRARRRGVLRESRDHRDVARGRAGRDSRHTPVARPARDRVRRGGGRIRQGRAETGVHGTPDASFELPTDEEAITDSAPVRSARSSCTSVQASPTRSPTCTTRDAPTRPS